MAAILKVWHQIEYLTCQSVRIYMKKFLPHFILIHFETGILSYSPQQLEQDES